MTSGEGEQFVVDHLTDDDGLPDNHEIRIQRLEKTLEQQRREIETLREELDEQAQNTEDIRDKLETDYWDVILDEIEART